jgi:transcription initiation factor TFIIB
MGIEIEPPQVYDYLAKFEDTFGLDTDVREVGEKLIQMAIDKNKHSGKAPSGFAAAAIYAACTLLDDKPVTQKELAEKADVCKLTIRNRYKELYEMAEENSIALPA